MCVAACLRHCIPSRDTDRRRVPSFVQPFASEAQRCTQIFDRQRATPLLSRNTTRFWPRILHLIGSDLSAEDNSAGYQKLMNISRSLRRTRAYAPATECGIRSAERCDVPLFANAIRSSTVAHFSISTNRVPLSSSSGLRLVVAVAVPTLFELLTLLGRHAGQHGSQHRAGPGLKDGATLETRRRIQRIGLA